MVFKRYRVGPIYMVSRDVCTGYARVRHKLVRQNSTACVCENLTENLSFRPDTFVHFFRCRICLRFSTQNCHSNFPWLPVSSFFFPCSTFLYQVDLPIGWSARGFHFLSHCGHIIIRGQAFSFLGNVHSLSTNAFLLALRHRLPSGAAVCQCK